jgi:hypothetical protein
VCFFAAVKFLPSCCLKTIGGYTYKHTDLWEGFKKYAVKMGSGAMIYIPSFIQIVSAVEEYIEEIHRQQDMDYIHEALISMVMKVRVPVKDGILFQ